MDNKISINENAVNNKSFNTSSANYTISYNLEGGIGNFPEQSKNTGVDINLHTGIPTKEGYDFITWESENTGAFYSPGERYFMDSSDTMKAVWDPTEHIFSFDSTATFNRDDAESATNAMYLMDDYYNNNASVRNAANSSNSTNNACVFAFEGLGGNVGIINDLHPEGYLKAIMIVTRGKKIVYITRNASTLPDLRPNNSPGSGITTLKEGVYDYKTGDHKGEYIALVPDSLNWQGWYINNNGEFYTGVCSGINIHATDYCPPSNGNHSEGCQTIRYTDYVAFGKAVGFLKSTVQNVTSLSGGVTASVKSKTGTTSGSNDISVSVKYILDRTFDENNDFYRRDTGHNCQDGIFYPIN